jgi:polar amino acid transport system substrate-binding protein
MIRMMTSLLLQLLCACLTPTGLPARTLDQIKAFNTLSVCLPANSLPFSSRRDDPPGFEVELARELALQLGVGLQTDWVISPIQAARAQCDLLLDAIADPEVQGESHLALSKPYYRSGVTLVIPQHSKVTSFDDLDGKSKVAVQTGSIVAMVLGHRHVGLSTFAFEDEMLQALQDNEVTAAAVSPLSAAYFNHLHPDAPFKILPLDDNDPRLAWNVAVGMRRPDNTLRAAINNALDRLNADGTLARIYGRYGIKLAQPAKDMSPQ